jgi:hypothetical protein
MADDCLIIVTNYQQNGRGYIVPDRMRQVMMTSRAKMIGKGMILAKR